MLFDSTLRKELSRSFGGTLAVILTIVLTMMLIRTLGQAALGRVSPQDVVLLLGYTGLGHVPTILCLSLFVAIVSTLTRLYRDSEMAVWFSSGVSLLRFLRPVLRFALPVLAMVAVMLLVTWPWANRQALELRARYEQRSDLSRVAPGQFQISGNGQRVFFIDKQSPDASTGRNIFIVDQRKDHESVTSALAGRIELTGDGARELVLRDGARTDLDLQGSTRTISRFDSYSIRIEERVIQQDASLRPPARSTLDLIGDAEPRAFGELAWRFGMALAGVNLVFLGVALANGSARTGSAWTLMSALLGFIVYFNVVNLSQSWVGSGKLSLAGALLLVHGGMATITATLFWWRVRGRATRGR
ncbi:LPS export ABC transporter permease LptF [Leptothrix discophora]|uniref:Lipopolysaccharide export system permease protein LptF n=1 Tax=Leptothrix discophora TaxID=89 RepID=A0ABT9G208_LEPDI|nr:LPS export ABC transporter permease LptF [Leptothrix discophora]MDP4300523.1 LPS export ABC transporter permease LptF [Leptothrix discophora]